MGESTDSRFRMEKHVTFTILNEKYVTCNIMLGSTYFKIMSDSQFHFSDCLLHY